MSTRIPSAPFYAVEVPPKSRGIKGPVVRVVNVYPCSTRPQAEAVVLAVDGDAVVTSFPPRPRLFREYRVKRLPRLQ